MSRAWHSRRTHSGIGEIAGAKPMVFRDCSDCGCRVYHHRAKRCNACALAAKQARDRVAGKASNKRRELKRKTAYSDMLRILGIREIDGDCA